MGDGGSGGNAASGGSSGGDNGGWAWLKRAGEDRYDQPHAIAASADGSAVVTGYFDGEVGFDTIELASDARDVFVVKYNAAGNVVWANRAGGENDDHGYGVATHTDGSVYVVGGYASTATFGTTTLTSAGSADSFLAKYDTRGEFLWAGSGGGEKGDAARVVSVLVDGSSAVAGTFQGSATFGATTLTASGTGTNGDLFLARYSFGGTVLWAKSFGGPASEVVTSMGATDDGSVYLAGHFEGTTVFGSTTLTSRGFWDAYLAKCGSDGTVIWAKSAGGLDVDDGSSLAVLEDGSVIVAGVFTETASFGSHTLVAEGSFDAFLVHYGADGQVLWATRAGGVGEEKEVQVAALPGGAVYVTGYFANTAHFDGISLEAVGSHDAFLAKYDPSGTALWATHTGSTRGQDGVRLAALPNGTAFLTGDFQDSVTLHGSTVTSAGGMDIFVAKWADPYP